MTSAYTLSPRLAIEIILVIVLGHLIGHFLAFIVPQTAIWLRQFNNCKENQ